MIAPILGALRFTRFSFYYAYMCAKDGDILVPIEIVVAYLLMPATVLLFFIVVYQTVATCLRGQWWLAMAISFGVTAGLPMSIVVGYVFFELHLSVLILLMSLGDFYAPIYSFLLTAQLTFFIAIHLANKLARVPEMKSQSAGTTGNESKS